jgi:hypothetical protein
MGLRPGSCASSNHNCFDRDPQVSTLLLFSEHGSTELAGHAEDAALPAVPIARSSLDEMLAADEREHSGRVPRDCCSHRGPGSAPRRGRRCRHQRPGAVDQRSSPSASDSAGRGRVGRWRLTDRRRRPRAGASSLRSWPQSRTPTRRVGRDRLPPVGRRSAPGRPRTKSCPAPRR